MNHELDDGAQEELSFWRRELAREGEHKDVIGARLEPSGRRREFPEILPQHLIERLAENLGRALPLRACDVGCGPLSTLAWGVDAGLLTVTGVDVLAVEYSNLMSDQRIDFPIELREGSASELVAIFGEDSFDVMFCRNALDHTTDIAASFDNMVRATRPGGVVVMQHHLTEGTHRHWSPSHKWDLDHGAGGLVARDRDRDEVALTNREDLELVYLSYRSYLLDGWIDCIHRRVR